VPRPVNSPAGLLQATSKTVSTIIIRFLFILVQFIY
jgi:hypothetical protein